MSPIKAVKVAKKRKRHSINHITQSGHHHMLFFIFDHFVFFEKEAIVCIPLLHFHNHSKSDASLLKWCIKSFKIKSHLRKRTSRLDRNIILLSKKAEIQSSKSPTKTSIHQTSDVNIVNDYDHTHPRLYALT